MDERKQDYASKARKIAKHVITGDEINRENGTRWSKIIDTLDVYATAALNGKYAKDGSISSIHTYWGGNQEIATEHKDGSRGLFQINGVRQSSNNAMDIEVEEYMNNINENKEYKTNKNISIFFTASVSIFMHQHKDTNKRARNMKFTSIFFTASASIFMRQHKDTDKRANNIKLA